jgi:MFS family permease
VRTFLVFLLAYVLSQFFRSFVAVIAPELSADLRLTPADLGMLSAAWFAAFAVAQLPVGWALDRFGPRRTVPAGMTAAVAGALLFANAGGLRHGIAAMALIGLGCAPVFMGALYTFGRTFAADRFTRLASWMLAFGSAGMLLSTTPLALATVAFGWRGTFMGVAAVTAVSALLIFALIEDPPRAARTEPAATAASGFRELLSIRALWPMLPLVFVSYAAIIAERSVWVGPYLKDVHGLGPVERGNATFAIAATMIGAVFAYGALDRFVGRKTLVGVGCGAAGFGFCALWAWPAPSAAMAVALIAALCASGNTYAILMSHGRSFLPEHLLGRGIAWLNFVFMCGSAVVQLLSGRLVDALKAADRPPADVYASLHLGFGLVLLAATAVYCAAPNPPR